MTAQSDRRPDLHPGLWIAIALALLAGAIVFRGVLPRYQFQLVGGEGRAMVIYDRWSGRFQRVNFDEQGEPSLTKVVAPF